MVALKNSPLNVLALAASATALTTSAVGTQSGCFWSIANVGSFNTYLSATASNFASVSDIISSTYTVAAGNSPLARRFDQANIGYDTSSAAITLTVPGGQTTGPISSAQLVTSYSDILYGSVRTVAKTSSVNGTTHGFSFYSNDTQEVDLAFVTSNINYVHFTNEQISSESATTSYSYAAPSDASTAFHEYRVDWVPGKTMFYIDSTLVQTITGNVPTTPGMWLWNNWSSGNSWAQGPPAKDNILYIKSVEAYFNRTSVASTIASGSASCAVVSSSSSSVKSSSSTASSSKASSSSAVVSSSSVPASTSSAKVSSSSAVSSSAVVSSSSSAKVSSTSSSSSSSSSAKVTSSSSSSTKASSTTSSSKTSSTSAAPTFYIYTDNSNTDGDEQYVQVSSGVGGKANLVSSKSSASQFTIDSNGYLNELNPTSGQAGYLLNSNTDYNDYSIMQWAPTNYKSASSYSYANCSIVSPYIECDVADAFNYAAVCKSTSYNYLYFGTGSVPSGCTWIGLYPVYA